MFNRKKKEQRLAERIAMVKPTSKSELKRQCLYLCNLNVEKAEKMYDFLIKDMGENIPDVEPASKTFIQNFGEQANGILGWFRENQDMLAQGFEFIRGIVAKKGGAVPPAAPLPPINQ